MHFMACLEKQALDETAFPVLFQLMSRDSAQSPTATDLGVNSFTGRHARGVAYKTTDEIKALPIVS